MVVSDSKNMEKNSKIIFHIDIAVPRPRDCRRTKKPPGAKNRISKTHQESSNTCKPTNDFWERICSLNIS